jgi:hypothetical protein
MSHRGGMEDSMGYAFGSCAVDELGISLIESLYDLSPASQRPCCAQQGTVPCFVIEFRNKDMTLAPFQKQT